MIISFCVAQSAAVARVGVLRCSEAAHSSSSPDPRSLRPPLSYTDQFADRANEPITLTPIGWVRSPYTERFGTPRQPVVETQVLGGGAQLAEIELAPRWATPRARRLDFCWVISHMHLNTNWRSSSRRAATARGAASSRRAPAPAEPAGALGAADRVGRRGGAAHPRARLRPARRHARPRREAVCAVCRRLDARAGWIDELDGQPDGLTTGVLAAAAPVEARHVASTPRRSPQCPRSRRRVTDSRSSTRSSSRAASVGAHGRRCRSPARRWAGAWPAARGGG